MKVLILAGGSATRLWPLCENRAKPLLKINNQSLMEYSIEKIPREIEIFVLTNSRYKQDFQKELIRINRTDIKIFCEDRYLHSSKKPGVLGAVSLAVKTNQIEDDILIFNGDNLLPNLNFRDLIPKSNSGKLAVIKVETVRQARKAGGIEISRDFLGDFEKFMPIKSIEEKPLNPKSKIINAGFMSIGRDCLTILHSFAKVSPDKFVDVFAAMIEKGKKIYALPVDGEWFDVGSFGSYLSAHKILQKTPLMQGQHSSTKSCKMFGKVSVGDNCQLKNCRIIDSIIYDNVVLEDCYISSSVIDSGCKLYKVDINQKLIRKNTILSG